MDYPTGTTDTTFGYDNDNHKTGMTDATGTTSYTYDNAGRLTQRAAPAGTVTYAYDNANRQTSRTLVGTGLTTLAYDNANRLTGVTAPNNENTAYTYDNADRLTQTTYANGSYETRSYDTSTADLSVVWHRTSGGSTTIAKQTYTYNSDGRRASETLADGALLTFGYDNAGQLTDEGRSGGSVSGYTIAYTYDNAGNRATKTLNSVTENYAYDAANKLTSAGGKTYTYDNAGNTKTVVSGTSTTTLFWDADSRLTGIAYPNSSTNTFVYNGLAQRVGTTDSRGTLTYTLADDSVDSAVLTDSAATYTHGLGLVSEVRGTTSKFYHGDALGTTRAMTGSTGSVTDTKSTDAFGNTFTPGSSGTTLTPFGFAGQHGYQSDPDSGLMRLGHRYYDSSVGRFGNSNYGLPGGLQIALRRTDNGIILTPVESRTMPNYLPAKDADLQGWLTNFLAAVKQDAALLGLSPADVGNLESRVDDFSSRLGSVSAGKTTFESAVAAKTTARGLTETDVREYVRRIQANPDVDNALKVSLGITVRSDTRSTTPPTTPTGVLAQPFASGVNLLEWNRNNNKPGTQFVIECKPPLAETWVFAAVSTKTRFSHTGQTPGAALLYRITAQRGGESSMPSEAVMVYGK